MQLSDIYISLFFLNAFVADSMRLLSLWGENANQS